MRDHTHPISAPRARQRWFGRIAAGCLLALAAGCADAATGPEFAASTGPQPVRDAAAGAVDITGVWPYHEDAALVLYEDLGNHHLAATTFVCSSDGTYTFVQTGGSFTGSYDQTGTCTTGDGTTLPNDFTGVTVTGTVQGSHLKFDTADGCAYVAAVRGHTLDVMDGEASCGSVEFLGTYTATFSATRLR